MASILRQVLACIAAMFALAGTAAAHPMPNSLLRLDVHEDRVDVELSIPLIELALALRWDMADDPQRLLAEQDEAVSRYILEHVGASAPDGVPWTASIGPLAVETAEAERGVYAELVTHLALVPPAGASTRSFSLRYNAVLDRVVSHCALVSVRHDWMTGLLGHGTDEARQAGVIRVDRVSGDVAPLMVDLSAGSLWSGFVAMFQLGMSHIAEGTDHILFLLTLLLPAPLLARGGVWRKYAGMRAAFSSIAGIVTAFTLGHSLTLILASLLRLQIPQQPVEVLIAATILVSAVHALRPLFPKREALVAGLFGLIHGTAFSFALAEMNLSGTEMAVSLLGFNLGIEVFQLAIIAVVMPLLLVIARTQAYRPLRLAGGAVASVAALAWLADRLGHENPVSTLADGLGPAAPYGIAALALLALAALVTQLYANAGMARR